MRKTMEKTSLENKKTHKYSKSLMRQKKFSKQTIARCHAANFFLDYQKMTDDHWQHD